MNTLEFVLAVLSITIWPVTIIGIMLWVRKQIYKEKE